MHAQVVGIAPAAPTDLTFTRFGNRNNRRYELSWMDNSKNETAFVIERRVAGSTDAWTTIATVQSSQLGVVPYIETGVGPGTGTRTFTDFLGNTNVQYEYQVYAINVVGDSWDYSDPAFNEIPPGGGWPTLTLSSRAGAPPPTPIAAPTNLAATVVAGPAVNLTWTDNATNETAYVVQRALDGVTFSALATLGADSTSYSDAAVTGGNTYTYRVYAMNVDGASNPSNLAIATIGAQLAAPTNVSATAARVGNGPNDRITLTWTDNANNETGYTIQSATNATFTINVVTTTVGANTTTFTTGNVPRNTAFYFRVWATNAGGSSATVNATPFPIITP